MKKIFNSKKGFTLVELLAVMVVLVAIGAIIVEILYSTIRGSSKTNLITVVRQNGNSAISEIVKIIRDAKSFDGVGKLSDGVDIVDCVGSSAQYDYIKVTSITGGQAVFICCPSVGQAQATIASTSGDLACLPEDSLLNTNAVALQTCSFTCNQQNFTDPPTIGIDFSLSQQQSGSFAEQVVPTPFQFQTSVSMRNFSR